MGDAVKQPPDFPTFSLFMFLMVLVFVMVVFGAVVLQDVVRMAGIP